MAVHVLLPSSISPRVGTASEGHESSGKTLYERQCGLTSGKLSADDVEAYKYAFSMPGAATATINYYRALFRFPATKRMPRISCPVLTIWGCKDAALDKGLAATADAVVDNYTVKYIEEASHWVMMDTPAKVNEHMKDFLE